jgi:lysozyme family protein
MRENFRRAFEAMLKHEGGYSAHPLDPGGVTNLGVTKTVWQNWVGFKVSNDQMRALTKEDVEPLYRANFWNRVRGDELPSGIDYVMFDAAVNSGPVRAIKWAQQVLRLDPDGKIGPKTMAAIQKCDHEKFIDDYCVRRLGFMQRLPIWTTFGRGWKRRVDEVEIEAKKLAVS